MANPGNGNEATMKAVVAHEFGGPEVLHYEDVPRPNAPEGDFLLLRVHAAGVNPGETKIRQGAFAEFHPLPMILGFDLAGVVEQVGPDVKTIKVGDAIYVNPDSTRPGGYAEYTLVREPEVALKPESLDFIQAASVPLAGGTAWQGVMDEAGIQAGQSILIHGAGGAVGSFAVQFAKIAGATVYATASGEDIAYVQSLGADRVIDYKTERFEEIAQEMDAVYDTIGGETRIRSFASLKKGGVLVSTLVPPTDGETNGRDLILKREEVKPVGAKLAKIAELIDTGKVKTRVGMVLPLAEAAKAHELVERGGVKGKVVLEVE